MNFDFPRVMRRQFSSLRKLRSNYNEMLGIHQPDQLLFLFKDSEKKHPPLPSSSWNIYSQLIPSILPSMTLSQICELLRIMGRVHLTKYSVTKLMLHQLISKFDCLSPNHLAELFTDVVKLQVDTLPIVLSLCKGVEHHISSLSQKQIARILIALSKSTGSSSHTILPLLCEAYSTAKDLGEGEKSTPHVNTPQLLYSLVLLNLEATPLFSSLITSVHNNLENLSSNELGLVAFSMVVLNCDAATSILLDSLNILSLRLIKHNMSLHLLTPVNTHVFARQLFTIDCAIRHKLYSDYETIWRGLQHNEHILKLLFVCQKECTASFPKTSALAVKVKRTLEYLLPSARDMVVEHPVGPYILDFAFPHSKVGIEVDGYYHFEPLGNKNRKLCDFKLALLKEMNWRTISIKYFEFENLSLEDRLKYIKKQMDIANITMDDFSKKRLVHK